MSALTPQPAEKGALQQVDIQAIGLGAPMLARDRDAGGMDDMGLDAARPQPAGQPEAIPTGLKSLPRRRPGATAMRFTVRPALVASSRQRCSSRNSSSASGASFFSG